MSCHSLYDSQISVVHVVKLKLFIRQSIIEIGGVGGRGVHGKLHLMSTISHFADVEPSPGPKRVK